MVDELSIGEETFAADGPDDDSLGEEVNLGLMEGLTVNQRFEEQPRSYFEQKVRRQIGDIIRINHPKEIGFASGYDGSVSQSLVPALAGDFPRGLHLRREGDRGVH